MPSYLRLSIFALCFLVASATDAQEKIAPAITFGPYEYAAKPDDPAFEKFNPRKAPEPGTLLLRKGDRLAIIGDSITEQKMYSRLIETYLTVCWPELQITARQYGWSGEKADGFLRRMDQDCLRFDPTVATLCYGMNDARYRPFDVTNGEWYRDHYTAVVRKLKSAGARVVLGSPGCSGKIASWVKSRSGTLDEHNLNLCALRDIGIGIAQSENVRFADIFWPMYQAQVLAPQKYAADRDAPYDVAGKDGIHPGWAGHVMMAYAFLNAMGIDGDIATIEIDLAKQDATLSSGHQLVSMRDNTLTMNSSRYPFCAEGPIDDDNSIRSGMTLVPFNEQLNRFTLKVIGLKSFTCKGDLGRSIRRVQCGDTRRRHQSCGAVPRQPVYASVQAGRSGGRGETSVRDNANQTRLSRQRRQSGYRSGGKKNRSRTKTTCRCHPRSNATSSTHDPRGSGGMTGVPSGQRRSDFGSRFFAITSARASDLHDSGPR